MGPVAVLNHRNATSAFVPRLLLLEQDSGAAQMILRELREGGWEVPPIIVVSSPAEFGESLRAGDFDVVLVDCTLRNGECPEAIRVLRDTRLRFCC
jgi:DNA-binding response OmpR family regulator